MREGCGDNSQVIASVAEILYVRAGDSRVFGVGAVRELRLAPVLSAIAPHIPQGWTVRFDSYRVGGSMASGEIARSNGQARVSVSITGEPLAVTVSPAFAAGARLVRASVNGAPTSPTWEENTGDTHFVLQILATPRGQCVIDVEEPAQAAPALLNPRVGDAAR